MNQAYAMTRDEAEFDDQWDLERIDFDSQEVTEIEALLCFETEVTEPIVVSVEPPPSTPARRSRACFEFLFRAR